uniref:Secreted protein n=1 Tax=Amphimedon queenslandica TaxID=400682 RepID=A0A1X7TDI5_AMPQE
MKALIILATAIASSTAICVVVYLKPLGGNKSKNISYCQPIQEEGGNPFGYAMHTSIKCSDKTIVTGTPKLNGADSIVY